MLHLFTRLKYIFSCPFFSLVFTNIMVSYDPGQGLIRDCNTMTRFQFLPDSYNITPALTEQLLYDWNILNVLCFSDRLRCFPSFYDIANSIS